jgi:hypothetical protein
LRFNDFQVCQYTNLAREKKSIWANRFAKKARNEKASPKRDALRKGFKKRAAL